MHFPRIQQKVIRKRQRPLYIGGLYSCGIGDVNGIGDLFDNCPLRAARG